MNASAQQPSPSINSNSEHFMSDSDRDQRLDRMTEWITKHHEQYLSSGCDLLLLSSDAINCPEPDAAGKAYALRVVEEVIAAGRAAKYEKAEILETLLVSGAPAERLLPLSMELLKRIGTDAFFDALERSGFSSSVDGSR